MENNNTQHRVWKIVATVSFIFVAFIVIVILNIVGFPFNVIGDFIADKYHDAGTQLSEFLETSKDILRQLFRFIISKI